MAFFRRLAEPKELTPAKAPEPARSKYYEPTKVSTYIALGYDLLGVLLGVAVGYVASSTDALDFAIISAVDMISSALAAWRFTSTGCEPSCLEVCLCRGQNSTDPGESVGGDAKHPFMFRRSPSTPLSSLRSE